MPQVASAPTPTLPQPTAGKPAAIPQASTTVPQAMSRAELDALRSRRNELSNQLSSAVSRRNSLAKQIERAPAGAIRVGLEARMTQLDERILNIENAIDETGRQLASTPAGLVASTGVPSINGTLFSPGQLTGISIVAIIFVLGPLATGFARLLWRRGTLARPSALPPESERRLERIEQAVDTIAIEVERISEGQRFVTQLMSRSGAPALGEGRPDAIAAKVPVERHPPGDERR